MPGAFLSFFPPAYPTALDREQKVMQMRVNQEAPLCLTCVHIFPSTRAASLRTSFSSPLKTCKLKLHLFYWVSNPLFTDLCLVIYISHYFIHLSARFLNLTYTEIYFS